MAWEGLAILGTDVFADAATLFGHSLAVLGEASLLTPMPDKILLESGAGFFLTLANAADLAALADFTVTVGINCEDRAWQASLLGVLMLLLGMVGFLGRGIGFR